MKKLLILPFLLFSCGKQKPVSVVPKSRAILVKGILQEDKIPVLVKPKRNWREEVKKGIKKHEGFQSKPYICPAGVRTNGWGFTGKIANHSISLKEAEIVLDKKLDQYRNQVLHHVRVPLTEYQLWSLSSFTYNCGEGNLKQLVNGKGRLNDGNYDSIPKIMPLYRKGGGKILRGLVSRRNWEVRVWNNEV